MKPYTLITGASRGLGRLFALALAKQGRPLLLTARDAEALGRVQAEVQHLAHVPVHVMAADLSTGAGVDKLFADCAAYEIDYVVNNAGFGAGGPFVEQNAKTIQAMLRVNVEALTRIAHHFLPQLQKHRGTLLQVASQAAFQPVPYMAAYAASKAYVLHLTEALQRELRHSGVRVAALCPAATKTDFFDNAGIALVTTRFNLADPQAVVDAALRAVAAGQPVISPGLPNKLASWSSRLLTRQWAVRVAEAMVWRR